MSVNLNDGMVDLGNTPMETLAIRNRKTKVVMLQRDYLEPDPKNGWAWEHVVRNAYHHSDQLEMLDYVPGEEGDPKLGLKSIQAAEDKRVARASRITMPDGQAVTKAGLKLMHHKTLLKFSKDHGVDTTNKTPESIRGDLMKKIEDMNATNAEALAQVAV